MIDLFQELPWGNYKNAKAIGERDIKSFCISSSEFNVGESDKSKSILLLKPDSKLNQSQS